MSCMIETPALTQQGPRFRQALCKHLCSNKVSGQWFTRACMEPVIAIQLCLAHKQMEQGKARLVLSVAEQSVSNLYSAMHLDTVQVSMCRGAPVQHLCCLQAALALAPPLQQASYCAWH